MAKYRMFIYSLLFAILCQQSYSQVFSDEDSLLILLDKAEVLRVSNPDSAVNFAQKAVLLANKVGDKLQIVKAEHQLGYCYYSKNDFDQSIEHLNLSLEIAKTNNFEKWIAAGYNRLGNVYQLKSNYIQALNFYKQALQINQKLDDNPEKARTLVNIGTVSSLFGSYQKSIEYFLEAMVIYESINDVEGIAWTSLNIARMFKRLGLNEKAMQYAETALNNYREIEANKGNPTGVTLSLTELGNIYYHAGNYSKALEYLNNVLEINTRNNNFHGRAANLLTIGIIYAEKGEIINAEKNLQSALELKTSLHDSIDLASLYRYLGSIKVQKGEKPAGINYLNKSLTIAQKHHLLSDIKDAYQSLSKSHSTIGDYQKALDYQVQYSMLKDSINSGEIARLEMQYDFEKREKEQEIVNRQKEAIQQVRLERQRMISGFTALAFILTLVLALVIFYFYREKKKTNQLLILQNDEIKRQKNEIENQKHEIETQRDLATRQRDQIADQQKLITDSIRYASRIQSTIMPRDSSIKELLSDYFVLYKPKNIVSGDFYWVSKLDDGRLVVAVADCTGHGVPGAFMSMLGITLLKELTAMAHQINANDILYKLRHLIISSLNQTGNEGDSVDGMDMSIILVDKQQQLVEYAGAYLPILICRKNEYQPVENYDDMINSNTHSIYELRGNKMPIGYHVVGEKPFSTKTFNYFPGDTFYMFSDGYSDQFGGPANTKFMMANFKKLLLNLQHFGFTDQKNVLDQTLEEYRGTQKQVDDILVMGFKI